MKRPNYIQMFLSLMLVFAILTPTVTLAAYGDKGKKHFELGMKFEASEDWDKAAEEFALAASQSPKNPEYKLHLARSLFNASQMYIKKGTLSANEKDYNAAYVSFRKAYAFDPTNELAHAEMDRMVRLQQELSAPADAKDASGLKIEKTAYSGTTKPVNVPQVPQKLERLSDLQFPNGIDLQTVIKNLARDLDLNVLFDTTSFRQPRKTTIDLKNVSAAQALDYIFLQEGLFFQKVGPRTIMVANTERRMQFQQLVLRTFYLANASPKDVAKVVQTAIPAQPGRNQTIVLTDDATNSVTIRDTAENIRLIGDLIASLDKDRAEVVMDVAIYEVNRNDLLQFGNQIGTGGATGTLNNIGGFGFPMSIGGAASAITSKLPFGGPASWAFGLPVSNFVALQTKNNTKLIASTQIHAFNNEDSSARIGQRVPVHTAQISNGFNNTGTGTNTGSTGNQFLSDVVNYEQVGLTLKFKPLVFPNQDVQVAMEIESKDVAGALTDTPIFTERTIKGTARVQNNKTLLLASVAQGNESQGRTGLPLLGLIPILGRLFTAPTKSNSQIDIIIAVTPRVIRAPAILPVDEVERPTGSMAVPTSSSLEAMIIEDERNEMLALARKNPTNATVQLPDQKAETPVYVRTSSPDGGAAVSQKQEAAPADTNVAAVSTPKTDDGSIVLKTIESGVPVLKLNQTANVAAPAATFVNNNDAAPKLVPSAAAPPASASLAMQEIPDMKAGTRTKVAIMISGDASLKSAVIGLNFDDKKLAVRSVTLGSAFGPVENTAATPFINQNGKMFVSLAGTGNATASGTLAYIEVEALADGRPEIAFEKDVLNVVGADGKSVAVRLQ